MIAIKSAMPALLLAATLVSTPLFAQGYPARSVRVVLGVAPGTAGDVTARVVVEALNEKLGHKFFVDIKAGANGVIAADTVAAATPDGYTLFFTPSSGLTITPHLVKKLAWTPTKSFVPIAEVGTTPLAVTVGKNSPINTMVDLIKAARTNPGRVKVGVLGLSMSQVAIGMLENSEGIRFLSVPYKGTGEMITAVMAGDLDAAVIGVGGLTAQLGPGGSMKAISVTTPQRLGVLPSTAAIGEVVPGYDIGSWFGFFAPAGTDPAIIATLNSAVNEALRMPKVKARLEDLGTIVTGGSADDLRRRLENDNKRFGVIIEKSGGVPQ